MAILTEEGNEYEVRIKRVPQGTYFKEYVKIGDREQAESTRCERYIVAEPGQRYEIEVTIKKGFEWGEFEKVFYIALKSYRNSRLYYSNK